MHFRSGEKISRKLLLDPAEAGQVRGLPRANAWATVILILLVYMRIAATAKTAGDHGMVFSTEMHISCVSSQKLEIRITSTIRITKRGGTLPSISETSLHV